MKNSLSELTIHSIACDQSPASILQKTDQPFIACWDKQSPQHPSRYGLFLAQDSIIASFSCPIPAWSERTDSQGEFVRGLWEYDLAELFIYSTINKKYQEFNFAPSGAWWSCVFSAYRVEADISCKEFPLKLETERNAKGWSVISQIPLKALTALEVESIEQLRFNLCLIEGRDPRHYLSAALLNTNQPDFHFFEDYLPLRFANP